jgi:hypothetical protein
MIISLNTPILFAKRLTMARLPWSQRMCIAAFSMRTHFFIIPLCSMAVCFPASSQQMNTSSPGPVIFVSLQFLRCHHARHPLPEQ